MREDTVKPNFELIKIAVRYLDPRDSGWLRGHAAFFKKVSKEEKNALDRFFSQNKELLGSDRPAWREICMAMCSPLSSEVKASALEVLFRFEVADFTGSFKNVFSRFPALSHFILTAHIQLREYYFLSKENWKRFAVIATDFNLNEELKINPEFEFSKQYPIESSEASRHLFWWEELEDKYRRSALLFTIKHNPSFGQWVLSVLPELKELISIQGSPSAPAWSDEFIMAVLSGFTQAVIRPVAEACRATSLKKEWAAQFDRYYVKLLLKHLGTSFASKLSRVSETTKKTVMYFYETLVPPPKNEKKRKKWQDFSAALQQGNWKALIPWWLAVEYTYHFGIHRLNHAELVQLGQDVYRLEAWQTPWWQQGFKKFKGFRYNTSNSDKERSQRISEWVNYRALCMENMEVARPMSPARSHLYQSSVLRKLSKAILGEGASGLPQKSPPAIEYTAAHRRASWPLNAIVGQVGRVEEKESHGSDSGRSLQEKGDVAAYQIEVERYRLSMFSESRAAAVGKGVGLSSVEAGSSQDSKPAPNSF